MGGLFGKPVKAPPVPPPPAIPDVGPEAGEQARKKQPRGRRETIITGDLRPSEQFLTGKKKEFG